MGYMKSKSWCSLSAIPHHQAWLQGSPNDATTGPKARASAPSERNMPITVPFCWTVPNDDATAVRNVGTVAAASNTQSTGLHRQSAHWLPPANTWYTIHVTWSSCTEYMNTHYYPQITLLLNLTSTDSKQNEHSSHTCQWYIWTVTKPAKPGWAGCLFFL